MDKGIIFYTDNKIKGKMAIIVRDLIESGGLPITSCSLNTPLSFGRNAVVLGEPKYSTYILQIYTCLSLSREQYVFFCEHDVLYHPSHFEFTPDRDDIFYYNSNTWRWFYPTDRAVTYDDMVSLSGLCCSRGLALQHYEERLNYMKKHPEEFETRDPVKGRIWGYEPGKKKKKNGGFTDECYELWQSRYPNVDIRHGKNFSMTRTSVEEFKHPPENWREIHADDIPGWNLEELFMRNGA